MAIKNINSYPAVGSINDADKVIIDGSEYTALQLQEYIGGDETVFDGTEEILKADKNTGRGTLITLAQLKAFVIGSESPVTANDIFALVVSGAYKKVTSSVVLSYMDTFDLPSISGLQVWFDATDNSTISNTGIEVTQLRDKSGNANHSNPSGGGKPEIATDGVTGKQVLYMGNSTSGLTLTTGLVNSTFTLFLVYKRPLVLNNALIAGASPNNNFITPNGSIVGVGGAGTQSFQHDDSMHEMVVMTIRQNSGVAQYWEFNGRQRIRTVGTNPAAPFYFNCIGALNNNNWCDGHFGGLAYYNSFLSDEDAMRVVRKLSQTHNVNPTPYYKIVAFGDSYTIGIGASTDNGWAYQVAASLGKKLANEGISGSRFEEIGGDTTSGYNRYPHNLIEYPANDRLYILYGFNDIAQMGASAAVYQTQLDAMVADLVSKGYDPDRIYIGTVPRMFGDANSAEVQQYGDAVRDVCTEYGCHCAEVYAAQVAGGGDSLFDVDELHPNDAGHTVIANAFLVS